jgi:VCBS repeat-containing protein
MGARMRPRLFFFVALALIALVSAAYADDVTVGGNVAFSALDGSVLDHDGVANGVFTVSDGNLAVLGTVNCNDDGPGNASACSMRFVVSGNMTIAAGGALYAENRTGGGSGGNITLDIGHDLLLQGTSGPRAGAIVSSGTEHTDPGGNITFHVAGTATLDAGSIVSSASSGGRAGVIAISANGRINVNGLVASGPGRALSATVNTGDVLAGGSSKQQGGTITIRSTATVATLPAISVGASGTIASQGRNNGSGLVLLEGCGLDVQGLVASVADRGTDSAVTLRSGTTLVVDGRDRSSLTGVRRGILRADSARDATPYRVRVLARDAIQILGPAGSLYALSSNPGANNMGGGTIDVVSTDGTVTLSGNVARAGDTANGDIGGRINIAAEGNVTADTAVIRANGDAPDGAGGAIALRSYSGAVSWNLGTGDVRPVGSSAGVPAARQGTIALTYCTAVSTTGSSFPTDGSAPAFFPTTTQTCSPATPSLPPGETSLPNCNDAPVATNDAYTVAEGGTLNVAEPGVLTNDVDAGGDPMTATLVSGPAHASSFSLNANGSFTYVHDGGETTSDSFTYRANDGALSSNIATVSITVSPVNDVPVAVNDAYTLSEGGTLHVAAPGVLANDTDPDGPADVALLVSGPAHASSFTLNPNGEVLYVHDGSATTSDSFTYKVNDGLADSNVATVALTITAVNHTPVANNDAYSTTEGGTLDVAAPGVLANDTDPANAPLTAALVSGPAHASSFTLNANGSFTYVHDGSETTADSFTYRASNGPASSNVATVTISVAPVNDAPVANGDSYAMVEGGTLTISAPGVLGNDTDPDSPALTAILVTGPAHAAFALNANGSFTYVHDGSETLSDTFTYKANDGSADSNVATVTITIAPVNDAPVANDDSYSVSEGGTLTVAPAGVLGNDTDPESPALDAILVSGPAHAASFTLNADGSFSYVHDGGETTSDSFTYKANDGSADSNVATVTITVEPVNDAPLANNDSYSVNEGGTLNVAPAGVLGNDTDAEGSALNAVLVSGPAHAASFTLDANGSFSYVHDGSETTSDSFTYRANDGALDSNLATVTISIAPVNDAPIANSDAYAVDEGGTLAVGVPGLLGNDTDPDSPALSAILVSPPAHASSFTLNPDGSFSYVHDGSETTSDSFTYKANDGAADSNVVTVTISVTALNDAPAANPDAYGVNEGGTIDVAAPGVLSNDTDSDSPLTAVLISGPVHAASFALNADGSFTYVHDGSETTSDSFTYKASDGALDSNPTTVTIAITAVNDAPAVTAGGTSTFTEGDSPTIIDGTITISDADSATLASATIQIAGNYAAGEDVLSFTNTATITGSFNAATGTLTLTGADTVANYQAALRSVQYSNASQSPSSLPRTVTWQVDDGAATSASATSTINVVPVNDAPVANPDSYAVNEGATIDTAAPGVLSNDLDPDSPLTAILVSGPAHASSFTLNPNGSFQYVHDGSETTSDSFTYKANDGFGDSNTVAVTINITAVNDPPAAFAFSGLPAQAGIRITYPAGKLGGTDVEAGTTITVDTTPINVVNGTVIISANGSFVFTPLPAAAGGTASFQYRVSDSGNPPPGASSAYVTVSFNVAGPAIYFTKSVPVGSANCTLGNECTVAGALASIGLSSNAHVFISDAGTQTLASIALNPGGTIIGQGVQAASFDAFFGIVAPAQGTLAARPLVNQARPTLAATITLNNNSQVRGFNLTPSGDGLLATSKTGLAVSQMTITSDANLPSNFCVNFVSSSGTFLFGNIAVNAGRNGSGVNFNGTTSPSAVTFANVTMGGGGDAVIVAGSGATGLSFTDVSSNSGRAVDINGGTGQFVFRSISANGAATGILVQNATGNFTVNGTNGNPGTGGTIQNCTQKGADFRASRNINLRGMTFTNNATVDGPGASCGRIDLSTANNGPLNCNANLSLLSVTNVTLINLSVTGSQQIGIDGQSVNGLGMQGTTVAGNGNGAGEDGVQISNLSGSVTLNVNNVFRDAAANLFEVVNDTGTMNATFTTSTFSYTNFPSTAGSGLQIVGRGAAVVNALVATSTFQNINSYAVKMDLSGAATGILTVGTAGGGNTFTNNALGIGISGTGTGTINYSIRDNTLTNNPAVTSTFGTTAISASFSDAGTRTGTIDNNTIGTNLLAAPASGCFVAGCDGIQLTDSTATGTHRVTVSNNRIFHVNGAAIRVTSSGSTDTFRARITNNIANFPDNPASSTSGILVEDGNATPNGVFMTCLDVAGNQVSGLWAAGTTHKSAIRILASRAQQFSLTNFNTATEYPAGAVTAGCAAECTNTAGLDGNAADYLSQQNPATVTAQTLSGGSSASQQRLAASAPWSGTTGVCP